MICLKKKKGSILRIISVLFLFYILFFIFMLKSILNDSRLTKEGVFSIVLLPPYSDEPYTFDYLGRCNLKMKTRSNLDISSSCHSCLLLGVNRRQRNQQTIREEGRERTMANYYIRKYIKIQPWVYHCYL